LESPESVNRRKDRRKECERKHRALETAEWREVR